MTNKNKKMISKLMSLTFLLGVAILLPTVLDASHMELVAPIQRKGEEVRKMIQLIFGSIAGIVLIIQLIRGCTTKDTGIRQSCFISAAWIAAGATAIYNFDNVLSFVGIK